MGSQTYGFSTVSMYFPFLQHQSLDKVSASRSESDGEWDFDAALMRPSTWNPVPKVYSKADLSSC